MKKYQIIYADPPWSYNDKMKGHMGAEEQYKTQDIKWIKNLKVDSIADKNCVLFLWVVSPMLPEGIEAMKAWGFKYKTVAFCWNKVNSNGGWISNLGRWTMGNVELCLLGTKGKPKRIRKDIKQLVIARRNNHSQKPNLVRKRIIELMGNIPRIELFARGKKEKDMLGYNEFENWDIWGNEVESDIKL
jgi:site-specific DNA-methyltransferase (adenine-specific)